MRETIARTIHYIKGCKSAHDYGTRLGASRDVLEEFFKEVRCFDNLQQEDQEGVEICDIRFPEADADVIFALHVFEIVPEPYPQVVENLRKHCKWLITSHHPVDKRLDIPPGIHEAIPGFYESCDHRYHVIHVIKGYL